MAQKRSAKEAFGAPTGEYTRESQVQEMVCTDCKGQLSAAAAARQAKLLRDQALQTDSSDDFVESVAGAPYGGHHSGTASDEDDGVETVAELKKLVLPKITFSTLDPTTASKLLDDDDETAQIEFHLLADQTATFIGEYDLKVVKGVVNIYGAMIHPDLGPQRVYALSTHALPSLTARSDSIIRITSTKSGLLKLAKLSPLFRNIGAAKASRSFQFLASNASDPLNRPLLPLELDEWTKRMLSRMNARLDIFPDSPILTIGPKSSGKSTFNRLLCNMIISRPGKIQKCWYLDLDPGQPEFGPPGQLSLVEVSTPIFGPPYTHAASTGSKSFRLVKSHTIAATTFKDDAARYLLCAADLVAEAESDPLHMIINSCGWTSGLGASTLASFLSGLPVTPEVILLGESPDSELAAALPASVPLHVVPRRVRVQGTRTPAEQRAMATMAYFHQKAPSKKDASSWYSKPLSTMRPWLLSYKPATHPGLTGILSAGQSPHPDFLAETLDGAVVAIVAVESGLIHPPDVHRTTAESLPYITQLQYPLHPKRIKCLGLVLIRGIDVAKKTIQLVTPVDLDADMPDKDELVLVRGGFDSPDWAYLEDMYASPEEKLGKTSDRPWVSLTGDSVEHGKVWRLRKPPMAGG